MRFPPEQDHHLSLKTPGLPRGWVAELRSPTGTAGLLKSFGNIAGPCEEGLVGSGRVHRPGQLGPEGQAEKGAGALTTATRCLS